MAEALKKLKMPLFIGCLKILRDNNKTHISDIMLEEELLKYMRLKRITKYELSKLFNNLIKGCGKDVRYMVYYINKGEKLREKSIDPDIRDKFIAYCDKLPFGIVSDSSHIDL